MIISRPTWYQIQFFLAIHKTPITVVLSALGSLSLGLFLVQPLIGPIGVRIIVFILFILSTSLSVLVNISPRYYERIHIASNILAVIYNVLELDESSRLTIHHIINTKTQTYEQITDYYPTNSGRGRRFVFTQGITGQAFRTRHSHIYSIPSKRMIKDDYQMRWAFTEDEISRLTQDRKSFYAYPIGQEGIYAKVVIYFDSSNANTFTEEKKEKYDESMSKLFIPILEELLSLKSPASN